MGVGDARGLQRRAVHGARAARRRRPLVAREQYGDLAVFGYVFAAFGAGTIVGSLIALRWRPRYPMRRA